MEVRKVFFDAGSSRLCGVLHIPQTFRGDAVLSCHGMLADKNGPKHLLLARLLCERGMIALRFDFSGRGESQGDMLGLTLARQLAECYAAREILLQQGARRIGIFGSSLGGTTAVLAAAAGKADALATLAAPVFLLELLLNRAGAAGMKKWKNEGRLDFEGHPLGYGLVEEAERLDLLKAAGRVKCPWLVLHGELDEVVPLQHARSLAEAGQAELAILAGADHRLSSPHRLQEAMLRTAEFFRQSFQE